MKKLFLFAAVAVLGLVACNKATDLADNSLPKQKMPETNFRFANDDDWGLNNTWNEAAGRCDPTPNDCFDEIVVTAPAPSVFVAFTDLVKKGNYGNIVDFVKDNYVFINEFMVEDDFDGLIAGKLFPSLTENKDGKLFLFLKEGRFDGEIVKVYPFVLAK